MINASILKRVIVPLLLMISVPHAFADIRSSRLDTVTFICGELLGRPTGSSIAVNLCADKDIDAFIEYGTQRNGYSHQSSLNYYLRNIPCTIQLGNLVPDTRYYYRVRYRVVGATEFLARPEHTFHTARPKGSECVFAIEADPHLDSSTSPDLYRRTLGNILSSNPDFLIDLGDTFMSEKLPVINQAEITKRSLLLRTFFDTVGHSVPLMLVQGNHDGELGWLVNGTPDNPAVWAANIRKAYYPNPMPDGFYSGDTTNVRFVGQRQNYYAWEWGNALFVVLDPYWYTTRKPGSSKDIWDWTLGKAQYDWFTTTLQRSRADFKFVFAHQLVGGNDTEGRGGIEAVPYYEMGGLNGNGTPGFAAHRPGWAMPLHQLMVEHHVSAFFHGHDHVFVKQDLDGIVYQELPQPGYFNYNNPEKSYTNIGQASLYGYTHGVILPSSGYLRVTVTDTAATVDYIRSYLPEHENGQRKNGSIAFSYIIRKPITGTSVGYVDAPLHHFSLSQNYPNPFNPATTISFDLPTNAQVRIDIFNPLGQLVRTLVDRNLSAGTHSVQFDASQLPAGMYCYRLTTDNSVQVKKMIYQK